MPGIGGQIKDVPSHFVVEEVPLYEPEGEGEHLYVRFTREGMTTRELQQRLARLFNLKEMDVGYAGMKDKHARVTQTFSLPVRSAEEKVVRNIQENLPVEILWARRHRNKLKRGHLLGNRFRIRVIDPGPEVLERAQNIVRALQEHGLPNFYGEQRFGVENDNVRKGREVLLGRGPRDRWLRNLLLSAYQAFLFNLWLSERIRCGWFESLLKGDVAQKTDTGGMFEIEDPEVEFPRFRDGEITYTGPIYGTKMRWPGGKSRELEQRILDSADVTEKMLKKSRLSGSRRLARLLVKDIKVSSLQDDAVFEFSLPKGAYATTLLRELMKS